MNKIAVVSLVALSAALAVFVAARATKQSRKINLPSSKTLTLPVPGYLARTNSFPATIALSPDGRFAAVLNMGYGTQETGGRQSISVLDLGNNQLRDFPDDRLGEDARQSYFIGLAFSSEGYDCNLSSRAERIASEAGDSRSRGTLCFHLYASVGSITDAAGEKSGDTGNGIAVYKFAAGQVTPERFIKIPPQPVAPGKEVVFALRKTPAGTAIPYPAGFTVIPYPKGDRLLVANNLSDNVVLLDAASGQILKSFDLSGIQYVPSLYPYTVVANKAGTRAWCSLWNSSEIAELNLETGKIARWIDLGGRNFPPAAPTPHPTAMQLSADEETIFVALANADTIVQVDLKNGVTLRRYSTMIGGRGSVPQAIILSRDGKHLYAASAALDAVAVFDVKPRSSAGPAAPGATGDENPLGYVPTGWYPSALAIAGNDLLIATAKGEGSGPNNMQDRIQHARYKREHPYIPTLIGGSMARLSVADIEKNLATYTRQVEEDNFLHADPGKFKFAGGSNPIRHVIYVLKENRAYDQVFGDLPVGNGDPSLTMYGAEITPNQHKLALQFGVLDNFYDSGEVSGDGHLWSTAATTSDYNEKNWPINYRGKERTYDFGGSVADALPLEEGIPDVDDPATGFLWDNLARRGLTYRVYGEFVKAVWCRSEKAQSPREGTPSVFSAVCPDPEVKEGQPFPPNIGDPPGGVSWWPWPIPMFKEVLPAKTALRGHFDPQFPDFNTSYPDQLRADEFLREFNEFVKAKKASDSSMKKSAFVSGHRFSDADSNSSPFAPSGAVSLKSASQQAAKELPQFILLYLPDDHTSGTRPGRPAPQSSVADNDLAVGRVVDAVSHSPYWDDTAIFVVEDDAQNGTDHVDAHRSIALVISKYAPRGGEAEAHSPKKAAEKAFVDHHCYTTVSMIRTMEELLGLPPMNLFDAHAPIMAPLFTGPGTQPAFQADDRNLRNGLIYRVNAKNAPGAEESSKMDFSRPDRANAARLNAILWRDAKGDTPMPPPSPEHDLHLRAQRTKASD